MTSNTVAIVGAGIAGLACATRLADAGWTVSLYDKGRGVGGRMATRRVTLNDGAELRFDHGAQYAAARSPEFSGLCDRLERAGDATLFPWPLFTDAVTDEPTDFARVRRFVGIPGMSAIPKALARDLDRPPVTGRRVSRLERRLSGWRLSFDDGSAAEDLAAVVVAVPAEQAAPLLKDCHAEFAAEAAACRTAPCWASLLSFEGGGEPAFGALRPDDDGPLAWLARTGDGQGWVAHASAEWSRAHLERDPEEVAIDLEPAVRRLLPSVGETRFRQAHRWRFAQVARAAETPHAWDEALALGVCGDWRIGPSVESAWRSGDGLGAAMSGAGLGRRTGARRAVRARP